MCFNNICQNLQLTENHLRPANRFDCNCQISDQQCPPERLSDSLPLEKWYYFKVTSIYRTYELFGNIWLRSGDSLNSRIPAASNQNMENTIGRWCFICFAANLQYWVSLLGNLWLSGWCRTRDDCKYIHIGFEFSDTCDETLFRKENSECLGGKSMITDLASQKKL